MKKKLSYLMMLPVIAGASQLTQAQQLEEVLVTATKRATSEMETPLSMETFAGDDIRRQNIGNIKDLVERIPNVHITGGAQTNRIAVRGLGIGNDRSFEQSVAMFIDGVYMPRSRQYRTPFFDMDRVEVLRGPQAVLYGLNATAGTILVHSKTTKAGDAPELFVSSGYETEFDGYFVEAMGGTSIGDNLGVRLAVRYNDTGDGYWENMITGEDENSAEETNVRFTADWAVSDTWNVTAKVAYTDAEEEGNYGEQIFDDGSTPASTAEYLGFYPDKELDWKRYTDNTLTDIIGESPGLDHDITNVSINSIWEIGKGELSVLLGYSESNYTQVYNVDAFASFNDNLTGSDLPGELIGQGLGNLIDEDYEQASIEIRYASDPEASISYILGLYADTSELTNDLDSMSGILLDGTVAGGLGIQSQQGQSSDVDTISPYASLTWQASERLQLTAGVRYSDQEKDYSRDNYNCDNLFNDQVVPASAFGATPGPGGWYIFESLTGQDYAPCGTLDGLRMDRSSDNWMPEAIAQYDLTENSVVYAKAGESAKAGGFVFSGTLQSEDLAEFDDETATGFEVGYKARLMDERLEVNAAIFYTEYDDLQVSSFNTPPGSAPILVVSNAGESTSQGLELEVNYAATDWLTVGTSLAYLDSEYDSYESGPCSIAERDATGASECDRSGDDTPYAAEYSGSAYVDWRFPLSGNLVLDGGVLVTFSDDYYTEAALNETSRQDAYEKIDARIGISQADDKWSVSVVGRNLTEEEVNGMGVPFLGVIGYLGAPRTITVQGEYRF